MFAPWHFTKETHPNVYPSTVQLVVFARSSIKPQTSFSFSLVSHSAYFSPFLALCLFLCLFLTLFLSRLGTTYISPPLGHEIFPFLVILLCRCCKSIPVIVREDKEGCRRTPVEMWRVSCAVFELFSILGFKRTFVRNIVNTVAYNNASSTYPLDVNMEGNVV